MTGTTSPNISSLIYRQHHDSTSYGAEAFGGAGKELISCPTVLCVVLVAIQTRQDARDSALLELNLLCARLPDVVHMFGTTYLPSVTRSRLRLCK
jgi:hypothetical protein